MTHNRININPGVMFGKPVIKGTRITVEQILRKMAGGMTFDDVLVPRCRDLLAEIRHRLPSTFVVLEANKIRLRPFPDV